MKSKIFKMVSLFSLFLLFSFPSDHIVQARCTNVTTDISSTISLSDNNTISESEFLKAFTNPLNGIVGYGQINTSTTSGSCGSHSGAVAISYLKGLRNNVVATRAMENAIYHIVPIAPGEGSLKNGYNSIMNKQAIPYRAVSINAREIPHYLSLGSPVVAHVHNHYVTIYGLINGRVFFSDGSHGYGTQGSIGVGAGGYLRSMSWSAFQGKMYGGYIGFAHK
ncbi:MAG: hypothetical protein HQK49_14330 [Oligoflexia bacterium]|nr:hypothetical protein [Oligoflexia bacterium]